MKIVTIQKIINVLSEDKKLLSSETQESYVLTPDADKILKNIKTGETISTKICVSRKSFINNYIEVEKPSAP